MGRGALADDSEVSRVETVRRMSGIEALRIRSTGRDSAGGRARSARIYRGNRPADYGASLRDACQGRDNRITSNGTKGNPRIILKIILDKLEAAGISSRSEDL